MSTPAEVMTAVQTLLENDSNLSYVKKVMLGIREEITLFPCIVLEPLDNLELPETYPRQELDFSIGVYGYIRATTKDKQLVGTVAQPGVLDLENDMKLALDSDRVLSCKAYDMAIVRSDYDIKYWPIRGVLMQVVYKLKQTIGERT